MALLGRLQVDLIANAQQFRKEIQGAQRSMREAGEKMSRVGQDLTKFVTLPLVGAGAAAFKMAADSAEAASKLEAVFGPATQDMTRWIAELRDTVPETTANLSGMTSEIGDLLIPLGIAPDAAQMMTKEVVQLAADLASFNNIPMAEALERIRAGLVGQNEPLLKFGVALDAATVKQRALEMGLYDGKGAVDAAARAQAAFQLILERTTAAHGDAARTAGSAANQFKFFWSETKELADVIGTRLLPVVTPMITRVTDLIRRVQEANPALLDMGLKLAAVAAAVGPVLVAIGKVLVLLGNLNPVIAGVSAALAVGVTVWLKWGEDITRAVQATANVVSEKLAVFHDWFVAASQTWYARAIRWYIDFCLKVNEWLVGYLGGIIKKSAELWYGMLRIMNPALARALDGVIEFVNEIDTEMGRLKAQAVADMADAARGVNRQTETMASESTADVQGMVGSIGQTMGTLGPGSAGVMTGPVERSVNDVRLMLLRMRQNFDEVGADIARGAGISMRTTAEEITAGAREVTSALGYEIEQAPGIFGGAFDGILGKANEWASSLGGIFSGVTGGLSGILGTLGLGGIGGLIAGPVGNFVAGLFQGDDKKALGEITEWQKEFAERVSGGRESLDELTGDLLETVQRFMKAEDFSTGGKARSTAAIMGALESGGVGAVVEALRDFPRLMEEFGDEFQALADYTTGTAERVAGDIQTIAPPPETFRSIANDQAMEFLRHLAVLPEIAMSTAETARNTGVQFFHGDPAYSSDMLGAEVERQALVSGLRTVPR